MEYVPLYSPADLGESAFIESLLKSGNVRYYIHGEVSTRVYPQLSLNQRTFYVHPADFRSAYAMLQDFIGGDTQELPDVLFGEEEETLTDAAVSRPKTDAERFPYWFIVLLGGYVIYKLVTD